MERPRPLNHPFPGLFDGRSDAHVGPGGGGAGPGACGGGRPVPVTIGSGPGCALVAAAPGVEPLHASLVALEDGRVELRDVSRTAGATFVDGEPVDGRRVLE